MSSADMATEHTGGHVTSTSPEEPAHVHTTKCTFHLFWSFKSLFKALELEIEQGWVE